MFRFLFQKVGFYLGRGVTWVVGFNGCVLFSLVCFNDLTLHFSHLTWVHVVIKIILLRLNCVLRGLLYFTYVLTVPGYM